MLEGTKSVDKKPKHLHISVCSFTMGKSNPCLLRFTVKKDLEKETIFVPVVLFNPYMTG